jgi:transcriptional regulator with XRE-family HTH domain
MAEQREPSPQQAALSRLGEFLRVRRLQMAPADHGVHPKRRRRAGGMRREEIAARAGISSDWYSRIELGSGAVPSVATLQAIGRALELNPVDTRYLFELAGLPVPVIELSHPAESLAALEFAVLDLPTAAAIMYDAWATPLCWNATADGLFRWSSYPDRFSRNSIIAGLTNPYYREFLGADYEQVARGVVGVFRRAYTTAVNPPPLAHRVYEFGMKHAVFATMWNENSVAHAYTPPGPFVRSVPGFGTLTLDYNDVTSLRTEDIVVRILAPHDAQTREKLVRIASLGTARGLSEAGD